MTFSAQVQVPVVAREQWERKPTLSSHNLAECELFQDNALADLLDNMPRENLFALHMGHDPLRRSENRLAIHDGLSGRELLHAVKHGRLWLNATRIHEFAHRHNALVHDLYRQLAAQISGFDPRVTTVTVLISSPKALVYYHVDGPANLLWHIRGDKRIWIYPPEERLIPRKSLEDIFAGAAHEYIPYAQEFDEVATSYDLRPGMLASWQPNSPHRVTNGDSFNVSLSTEHFTPSHRKKARVYKANRIFRLTLGLRTLSTRPEGIGAFVKHVASSVAARAGVGQTSAKRHVPALRIIPDAPDGVGPL